MTACSQSVATVTPAEPQTIVPAVIYFGGRPPTSNFTPAVSNYPSYPVANLESGDSIGEEDGLVIGAMLGGASSGLQASLAGIAVHHSNDPAYETFLNDYHQLAVGPVPVSFWSLTRPKERLNLFISSIPSGAYIVEPGDHPTSQTDQGFAVSFDLVPQITIEKEGYMPCKVVDVIKPGFRDTPDGQVVDAVCILRKSRK